MGQALHTSCPGNAPSRSSARRTSTRSGCGAGTRPWPRSAGPSDPPWTGCGRSRGSSTPSAAHQSSSGCGRPTLTSSGRSGDGCGRGAGTSWRVGGSSPTATWPPERATAVRGWQVSGTSSASSAAGPGPASTRTASDTAPSSRRSSGNPGSSSPSSGGRPRIRWSCRPRCSDGRRSTAAPCSPSAPGARERTRTPRPWTRTRAPQRLPWKPAGTTSWFCTVCPTMAALPRESPSDRSTA
jgi:hypothetical protein